MLRESFGEFRMKSGKLSYKEKKINETHIHPHTQTYTRIHTQGRDLTRESGQGPNKGGGVKEEGVSRNFGFYIAPRCNMMQY